MSEPFEELLARMADYDQHCTDDDIDRLLAEIERLDRDLAECRRLLREACDKLDESEFMEVKVVWLMDKWFDRAQEAAKAGGE